MNNCKKCQKETINEHMCDACIDELERITEEFLHTEPLDWWELLSPGELNHAN